MFLGTVFIHREQATVKASKNVSKRVTRQHCMASMTGHGGFEPDFLNFFILKDGRF